MSPRAELLHKINSNVNQYPWESDPSVWHQADYWERISKQARGDCDDFVMEKRWQCLENGIPLEHIRIAMCFDPGGGPHAILIVHDPDEGGDWILDNQRMTIFTLDEFKRLGYRPEKLQVPGHWLWEVWR